MALVINHNLGAERTLNLLEKNQTALGKDLKAAASGAKINDASDGASEYAISRRLEIEERGLGQDIQNVKTGGDLLAVAEGGIREVVENLRDMKQLAINAANDTNTDADRATIEKEFSHRQETIKEIAATTNYNGKLLLDGTYYGPHEARKLIEKYNTTTKTIQVGPPSIQYVPGANGTTTIIQNNSLAGITSNFTNYDANTKKLSNLQCQDKAKTVCPGFGGNESSWTDYLGQTHYSYSNTKVTIDFSGATVAATGATPTVPTDWDKQGFALLCDGCGQYINIKFDANLTPANSYSDPAKGYNRGNEVDYYIGISGVTNTQDLAKALFDGIAAANQFSPPSNSYQINTNHTLNINYDSTTSSYYISKARQAIGVFDQGTIISQIINYPGKPGTEIITGPTTKTVESIVSSYFEEITEYIPGHPLVIHDTTHASNAIHVFIDSMHPRAITGKVPKRDENWEIIPERDKVTGEILKDGDGNPIPKEYIDPDPTLEDAHVRTRREALEAIDILDMAMNYALDQITDIGAYRMRLEQDEDKITVQQESATASKSTIQDADMAATMTNLTKHNVLTQAAQMMLAQANQDASRVLSLLQ